MRPSLTALSATRSIPSCSRAHISGQRIRAETPALIVGSNYSPDGAAFSPTRSRKRGKLYRFYGSQSILIHGAGSCPIGRVTAGEFETAVIDQVRAVFRQPEIIAGAWDTAKTHCCDISLDDGCMALLQFDPLWDELFTAEQTCIIALAVERVDIGTDAISVRMCIDGLAELAQELLQSPEEKDAAA